MDVVPHDVPLHPGLFKDFEPMHKIGEGGYAVVLRVRERSSGSIRVIKKINDAFASDEDAQRVVREVAYQRAVSHPNILPLIGCFCSTLSPDIYLLCPYLTCDLHEALSKILALTTGGVTLDAEDLADLGADPGVASALLAEAPTIEPIRLGKSMPRVPAEGIELCRELLQLRPSSRLSASSVLRHAYFRDFVKGDAGRAAYAERSCAAAASYQPPLDDDTRLSAAEYRRCMETSIATPLQEPVSAPTSSAVEMDDMGA